jgi:hypothetical protein
VALVLTLPAWVPILRPDIDLWVLPDGDGHLHRTLLLGQLIADGHWYPRWFPQHLGGYGYPTPLFYAPSVYYLTVVLATLIPGVGLYEAFQLVAALAAVTVIGGAYTLGWRLWQHGPAAVLTASAVAYAPYLLQANLFIRGALPEALGLGLLAWLLVGCHGLWQAATRSPHFSSVVRWWWFTAGITTFLLLTHNLASILAAGFAMAWLGALWAWRPSWRAPVWIGSAGLGGAALAAFFWIPAFLSSGLVQVERMQRGQLHYGNWFIQWPGFHPAAWGLQERSPWTPGFPIDLHLIYPNSIYGSPKASLWQAVAVVVALGVLAFASWPWRFDQRAMARDRRRMGLIATAFGAIVAVVSYAQLFDWALPYWEKYRALRTLQFPMRFLGPMGFGVALAAGGAMAASMRATRTAWILTTCAVVALIVTGTGHRLVRVDPERSQAVGVPYLIEQQRLQRGWTYGESGEFLPKTANYVEWHEGEARGFWLYERMFPEASWIGGRVLPWEGDLAVHAISGGRLWTSIDVGSVQGGTVAFHQLAFPGWRAWIDDRPVALRPAPLIEAQAIQPGFILVDVPPGRHRVAIRFGPDGPRLAGASISLAVLLAAALWARRRLERTLVEVRPWWRLALNAGVAVLLVVPSVRLVQPLRPPSTSSPDRQILVLNVTDAVIAGQATVNAPTGPIPGPDRFLDVRNLSIRAHDRPLRDAGSRSRRWLFTHPPTEVAVEFLVPADGYFQTSLALDPQVWETEVGDGIRFVASVTPRGGAPATVLDVTVNPRAQGEQRRWLDFLVDLRPWSGQHVRLTLRADARQEPSFDWAGWGEPVIVRLDPVTAARLIQSTSQMAAVAIRQ